MGYKLLGYVVWHGARLVVRRKYGHLVPSRGVLAAGAAGVVALGVVAAVASSRRGD